MRKQLIALVTITILAGGYFLLTRNRIATPLDQELPVPTVSNELPAPEIKIPSGDVFITYIPHIDKANSWGVIFGDSIARTRELDVIPRLRDLWGDYYYEGKRILVGWDKILIYDAAIQKVVAQSNPDIISCVSSSAQYQHWLFVACSGDSYTGNTGAIYRIDLSTGKIDKVYTPENTRAIWRSAYALGDPLSANANTWVNPWLLVSGSNLWVSSWGGVLKLDLGKDGEGKFYTPSNLGFKDGKRPGNIYEGDGSIKVPTIATSDLNDGISEYNPAAGTWKFTEYPSDKVYTYSNTRLEIPSFLPQFLTLSNSLNGKYYLTERNGVYIINPGKMPEFFVKTSEPFQYYDRAANLFVSSREDYAALFSKKEGGIDALSPVGVQVINLKTGVVNAGTLSGSEAQEIENFFKAAKAVGYANAEEIMSQSVVGYSDRMEIKSQATPKVLTVYFDPVKVVVKSQ